MEIKAAVVRAKSGPFTLETCQIEDPRAGEILVRVVACGVCHTDMVMRDQHLPTPQPVVLGHEGSGYVEKVGAGVKGLKRGDRVVMSFNSCGRCPSCHDHAPAYCHEFFPRNFVGVREDGSSGLSQDGHVIHGNIFGQSSFATYALCHERNAVKVSRKVPIERLGPLGCGVLTGAGAVINALKVTPGKTLAVFGSGAVGLSAIMAAVAVGAGQVIAVDLNEQRLSLARELGAGETLNPLKENVVERIMALTGTGVDFSIDTTANLGVMRQAVDVLAPRGTAGLVGASKMGDQLGLDAVALMSAGRSVRGIVEGDADPHIFIPKLIELHLAGKFPFDRLITYYPMDRINEAVRDAEYGDAIKPIVMMADPRAARPRAWPFSALLR